MPGRWVRDGVWRFRLLDDSGSLAGAVQPCGPAQADVTGGHWWVTVAGVAGGRAYTTRRAALRAVMVESQSDKRARQGRGG